MTVFNGQVLFNGWNSSGRFGLWVTDGTAQGTHEVTNISGTPGVNPSNWTPIPIPWTISASANPVDESAGSVTFTITRPDNSTSETVFVSTIQTQGYYNAASGTTSTNYYYRGLVNVPYTFAVGQNSIQVPVSIFDRGLRSGSEKFGLEVQSSTGAQLASTAFSIVNNDTTSTTYAISPSPAAVNENSGTLTFTITRSDNTQQQTIEVSTVQDQGYVNAASGTISTNYYYDGLNQVPYTFAAGQNSIPVTIMMHDRGLTSGSEQFSLNVQSTSGAQLASTSFTILNSDHAPAIVNAPPSDVPPTIQGPSNLSELANTWLVDFGSLIHGSDSDGNVTSYRFTDISGAGFFTLGGIRTGNVITAPASQSSSVGFNVGSAVGSDQIEVRAIDNQGAVSTPVNVTLNVTSRVNAAAAPDVSTLADLSMDVYQTVPSGAGGYAPVPFDATQTNTIDEIDGFRGVIYSNSDHSQVVIAFRGTNPKDIENLLADGSWVGLPSTELQNYFDFAVYLLEQAEILYPNARISLTGHSLGGALAELVGEASHLSVTAFDAPGAQDFYSTLLSTLSTNDPTTGQALANQRASRPSQVDTSYRLYGDIVSTVGSPIGTAVTLPWPGDPNDLNALDHHSISLLDSQIHRFAQGKIAPLPNGIDEPGKAPEILVTALGAISAAVKALVPYFGDPPGNSDFILTQSQGSPTIESIQLPILPGIQSYAVRYETGSSWSAFERVWPAQWQAASDANSVEFIPLDSTGHSVSVTDPVMFGLVFGATGTVNATLTSSNIDAFFGGSSRNDLNGDGVSDVLWHHTSGELDTWLINNGLLNGGAAVSSVSIAWRVAGIGDIDGNGTADVVWQNTTSGAVESWLINNGQLAGGGGVGFASSAWQPLGTGDWNGDGTADVLWRNANNGEVDSWLLSNGKLVGGAALGSVSSAWQFAGIGDFNADGASDVLWHNTTTGEVDTWLINNGHLTGGNAIGFASSAWQALGTGDFNADGTSDILWRNINTGEVDTWLMNNGKMVGGAALEFARGAWQFAGIGDFTGTGTSDVLWRNMNTGEVDTWLITNDRLTGGTAIGTASSAWQPQVIHTA